MPTCTSFGLGLGRTLELGSGLALGRATVSGVWPRGRRGHVLVGRGGVLHMGIGWGLGLGLGLAPGLGLGLGLGFRAGLQLLDPKIGLALG